MNLALFKIDAHYIVYMHALRLQMWYYQKFFFFLKGGQTVDLSRSAEAAHKNRNKSLKNIIHENEIEETYNINDAFSIFI